MIQLGKLGCSNVKLGVEELSPNRSISSSDMGKTTIEKQNSNVASCSTLSPASTIATTGRSKVALKPGRSLMDWIRFTHSGCDLTSTNGKIELITHDELIKHNKRDDAWICLRGKVYNITPYLEYHPGGEDELMRGAGKDATELFNEVHKWVNAESMLQKCYVGPYKGSSLWILPDTIKVAKPKNKKVEKISEKQITPTLSWCQTTKNVHITIQNGCIPIKLYDVISDIFCKNIYVKQMMKNLIYLINMELKEAVQDDYRIETDEQNNVNILIQKKSESLWNNLGLPLDKHNMVLENDAKYVNFRPCVLVKKDQINYNTIMLQFKLQSTSRMIVPIGCHVNVKLFVEGEEITRSYTPVIPLNDQEIESTTNSMETLFLLVKVYDDGILTPVLNKCEIGEEVQISDYMGNFVDDFISFPFLILLAAGTGITPMIKIIESYLKVKHKYFRVLLIFFNRSDKDIIFHEELIALMNKDTRFTVCHVLSEPDDNWQGETGYIRKELLQKAISTEMKISDSYCCICGPRGFCASSLQCIEDLSLPREKIHIFSV